MSITITSTPDALAERIFNSALGALDVLAIHVGSELGWYAALAEHGSATADELATATGTNSRYAREWLEQQAVGGVLEVDDVAAEPRIAATRCPTRTPRYCSTATRSPTWRRSPASSRRPRS